MMKALSLGGSLLWSRMVQGQQALSDRWPSDAAQYPADSREHGHSVWSGGRTVAPHVRVHLREARLDVGLCAALPHGAEAEALGRVVQLQRRSLLDHMQRPRTELRCGAISSANAPFGNPRDTPIFFSALTPTPVLTSPGLGRQPLWWLEHWAAPNCREGKTGGRVSKMRPARSRRVKETVRNTMKVRINSDALQPVIPEGP